MMKKSRIYVSSLAAVCLMLSGCFDIDQYVNFIPEEPDAPERPYEPSEPDDIPDQEDMPVNPPGSGGITPSPDDSEDGENTNPGTGDDSGGELVIPDTLEIEFVNPSSGDVRGGYEVRVRGKALEAGGHVRFGSLESPQQIFVNSNVVRAVVPAGRLGCVDVTWIQGDETVQAEKAFCYTEDIQVTSVEPSVMVAGNPTPVVIRGVGFDDTTRPYFGESMVEPIEQQLISGNEMAGILAFHEPGMPKLHIANATSQAEFDGLITVLPGLSVERAEPPVIVGSRQTTVTVTGSGFDKDIKVRVGNAAVTPSEIEADKLTFLAPSLSAGSYDILVYDGYRQARLESALHYISSTSEPGIVAVTPAFGTNQGGDVVTIVGSDLPQTGQVMFGEKEAVVVERSNASCVVKTPAGQGIVDVKMGKYAAEDAFEYLVMPEASGLTPEHAVVGDEPVMATLTGSGFGDGMRVKFGAFESPRVTVENTEKAIVQVPKGTGSVGLQLLQGKVSVSTGLTFTYDEIPDITGVNPNQAVILGGTQVEIYGHGFEKGLTLWIDDQKVENLSIEAANLMTFVAPEHEAGEVNLILKDSQGNEIDREILTYFNPSGINTSASGGAIKGQLHVTVLTVDTAAPIPNATVYIGSDLATARKRVTDANGRTSFFDEEIVGAQTIIACAPEHSCNTLQPINASNVTLFLEDWHLNDSDSSVEPPPEPPPLDGEMINPIDVTVPYTPKPSYFTGTVGGFGKFDLVSDPNIVHAGLVAQSMLSPYAPSYYADDVYLLFNEGDTYRIRARSGDVAIALICGFYNTQTNAFTPKYFGVKRHQMVTDGVEIVNHLECPLPLNQIQSIKLLNAPLKSGPNIVVSNAYLFLGNEGYIGGFMNGKSETDLVVISNLPPLRQELEEASFAFVTGAYTNMGYPASVFYEYNVMPQKEAIEVGPAVPIPIFLTPSTEDILSTGKLAWKVEHPQNVDFYEMTIRLYSSGTPKLLWQFYLPGTATTAEFPRIHQWPDDLSGQLYVQIVAYKSVREGFDFNLFSTGDLRHNYIHSSAYATLYIRDPARNQQ